MASDIALPNVLGYANRYDLVFEPQLSVLQTLPGLQCCQVVLVSSIYELPGRLLVGLQNVEFEDLLLQLFGSQPVVVDQRLLLLNEAVGGLQFLLQHGYAPLKFKLVSIVPRLRLFLRQLLLQLTDASLQSHSFGIHELPLW